MSQPIKKQQIIGLFGEKAGTKLLNWLDPCCEQFCLDVTACGGGGGGNPSLPFNSVQYNNAGNFFGDSNFTRNPTTQATAILQSSGNVIRGFGIEAFGPDSVFLGNIDLSTGDGATLNLKQSDPTQPRLRLIVDYPTGNQVQSLDLDGATGNALTWDSDTTDSITARIEQSENLFTAGIKGTAIDYSDSSSSEQARSVWGNLNSIFGFSSAAVYHGATNAAGTIATNILASSEATAGAVMSYQENGLNSIEGAIQLQQSGNSLTWNANTTGTVDTALQQNQDIFGLGSISGTFITWKDTATNIISLVGAGDGTIGGGFPGDTRVETANVVTGRVNCLYPAYANDAAAGLAGLIAGDHYQTDGTDVTFAGGAVGLVVVKQ